MKRLAEYQSSTCKSTQYLERFAFKTIICPTFLIPMYMSLAFKTNSP